MGLLAEALRYAKEVMEWLLILAVREDWAVLGQAGSDVLSTRSKIDIPERYGIWAEVADGRLAGKRARLELASDKIGVLAPNCLVHDDLEKGLLRQDALAATLEIVWTKVMKCPPPTKENWQAQLPRTLKRLYKDGERYYVTIPHVRYAEVAANPVWNTDLRDKLAGLGVFVYGSGEGDPILVIPEDDLLVDIRLFLRLLREYE